MATITCTVDARRELTIQTVAGVVTANEIAQAIESYYAAQSTRMILWDFTDADVGLITGTDVHALVALTRRFSARRPGGKTAMVFSSELGFGLGRMFDIQQDSATAPISHASFRDRKEALDWLFRDAAPEP